MENNVQQTETRELSVWYHALPKGLKQYKRERIMKALEISRKQFYRYLDGEASPHPGLRYLVDEIAECTITYKHQVTKAKIAPHAA